jgi:hypothetical protein
MRKSLLTFSALAAILVASYASAGTLTGDLTGQFNFNGNVDASATGFDFLPVGQGTGDTQMQFFGNTGPWSSINGTSGLIQDTTLKSPSTPGGLAIGQALNQTNWLSFNAAPNITFTLTRILPGTFSNAQCDAAPAAGQTCTPFLLGTTSPSATNFVNSSVQDSTANFTILGRVFDSLTGRSFDARGQLVSNFQGQNYQQVLAEIAANGFVSSSYTGQVQVTTAVPEPDMVAGLLLAAFGLTTVIGFKRTRRA